MLDIDHFKRINDGLGHLAGDEVIRKVSALIAESLRETDRAGRYGGEEFGIYLPETSIEGAKIAAERIRHQIEEYDIMFNDKAIKVTISAGVSVFSEGIETVDELIDRADKALYHSKKQGRNQVTLFDAKVHA